jgi:hypothetical protein
LGEGILVPAMYCSEGFTRRTPRSVSGRACGIGIFRLRRFPARARNILRSRWQKFLIAVHLPIPIALKAELQKAILRIMTLAALRDTSDSGATSYPGCPMFSETVKVVPQLQGTRYSFKSVSVFRARRESGWRGWRGIIALLPPSPSNSSFVCWLAGSSCAAVEILA